MLGRCRGPRFTALSAGGTPSGETCSNQFADLSEVCLILLEVGVHQAHNQPSEERTVSGGARGSVKQLAQEDLSRNPWGNLDARVRREGFETGANDLYNFNEVGFHGRHLPNGPRLSCGRNAGGRKAPEPPGKRAGE